MGGSLNISLSNDPVFLGGYFIRVEPLEVICLCGFHCCLRVIWRVWHLCFFANFFLTRLMYVARYVLGSNSAHFTRITVDGSRTGLSVHCYHCWFLPSRPRPIMCKYNFYLITACGSNVYLSYTQRINKRNAYKISYTNLQNLEICRVITTHNYLTLYP